MKNVWGLRWYVLCVAVVRVSTYPVNKSDHTTRSDLESFSTDYIFEDLSPTKFIGVDSGLEDFDFQPGDKKNTKVENVLSPLTLEPDAEMLPPNFKGVVPPGVDHMELRFREPQVMATNSRSVYDNGVRYVLFNQASQGLKNENGREKAVEFENRLKGVKGKEKQKKDYTEAGGRKKAHTVIKNNFNDRKDQVFDEKNGSYGIKDNRNKDYKAEGFHSVYHKDEHNKNSDFYDNDHQGGHFKKHGRYGEKHSSLEHVYKKGSSHDSAFDLAEAKKKGGPKSLVKEEVQGHPIVLLTTG
ncbi:uncharacterized protein LOC122524743 [Polistes fuscatus]|uniref:uncharacterized protein LOC122524743 n=1 Tax=Polistes fuscatus TaxID=30207 RepID=UPI001CA7D74B|nr:uncharacterized protein LOC122524743 [Polistes fuscatus]